MHEPAVEDCHLPDLGEAVCLPSVDVQVQPVQDQPVLPDNTCYPVSQAGGDYTAFPLFSTPNQHLCTVASEQATQHVQMSMDIMVPSTIHMRYS